MVKFRPGVFRPSTPSSRIPFFTPKMPVVCTGFAVRVDFPSNLPPPPRIGLKSINTSRTDLRGTGQDPSGNSDLERKLDSYDPPRYILCVYSFLLMRWHMRRPAAAVILFLVLSSFIVPNAWPEPNYGRKELNKLISGKTKKEVRALLGSPNSLAAYEDDDGGLWRYGQGDRRDWGFRWTVLDEDSGVPCWGVSIKFKNGNAVNVSVYSCMQ